MLVALGLLVAAGCAAGQGAGGSPSPAPVPLSTGTPTKAERKAQSAEAPTPGPVVTPAASAGGWRYAYVSDQPGSRLTDVTAAGPREAWAVGAENDRLLLLHHDGTAWRRADPPPGVSAVPPGADVRVAASGPDDVWLLLPELAADDQVQALSAVRWDGSAWRRVPGRIESPYVTDFAVAGPADAWAVHGPGRREAAHWDGRSWTRVPLPAFASALGGSGSAGLWAVGFRSSGEGVTESELDQPAAMRWDGRSWRLVPTPAYAFARPKPAEGSAALDGVLVLERDDVWAIGVHTFNHGEVEDEPADPPPILLHWDGRSWSRQSAPADRGYCCPRLAAGPSGGVLVVTGSPRLRDTWRIAAPGASAVPLPRLPAIPGLKRSQFFKVEGSARSGTTWAAGTLSADGGFWSRAAIAALS
ncbi:hypothetical protein Nocox_38470 [Nonomuraea coxensis DSM 45129]|uniref:Lipoprotein n=1 Tax=Nonomuraea coxensis DSM 45129 TaxID=1122611 RepID=A0ABX8UBV6_9ACTN|nr:hypothetical protein Nocox_38470 [Nonomuraea coxensis DSM 45129]